MKDKKKPTKPTLAAVLRLAAIGSKDAAKANREARKAFGGKA